LGHYANFSSLSILFCKIGIFSFLFFLSLSFFIYLFIFCLLGQHPQHMEVPKLQLAAYTTATATPDPTPDP